MGKGLKAASLTNNKDLYGEICLLIHDKQIQLSVRWMPSHLKDGKKVRPPGTSDMDIEANDKADELAGLSSAKYELPKAIATVYINALTRIKQIQQRLATILMYLPQRVKVHEKRTTVARVNYEELLCETKHNISIKEDRYHCHSCLSSFRINDPAAKHWLKTSCVAPFQTEATTAIHKPRKIHQPIHIGNQTSHSSHELFSYRGLMYCKQCGSYGVKKFSNLNRQCEAPTVSGLRVLKCIDNGVLPSGITGWPDQVSVQKPL